MRSSLLTEEATSTSRLLREAGLLLQGETLYDPRTSPSSTTSTRRCAPTSCSSATRTTSSRNDEVIIIDEFTGRMMPGRRYSDGLHQALEAKEHVDPAREPDARLDHLPELLPPLREARRHDRHGLHRGRRVHGHLQARRGRDPDQPADGSAPTRTTRSTAPPRRSTTPSSRSSRTAHGAASRSSSAPPRSRSPRTCPRCSSARSRTTC
jgi:hypothetical protein